MNFKKILFLICICFISLTSAKNIKPENGDDLDRINAVLTIELPNQLYSITKGVNGEFFLNINNALIDEIKSKPKKAQTDFLRELSPWFLFEFKQTSQKPGNVLPTYTLEGFHIKTKDFRLKKGEEYLHNNQRIIIFPDADEGDSQSGLLYTFKKPIPFGGNSANDQIERFRSRILLEHIFENFINDKKKRVITIDYAFYFNMNNEIGSKDKVITKSVTLNIVHHKR